MTMTKQEKEQECKAIEIEVNHLACQAQINTNNFKDACLNDNPIEAERLREIVLRDQGRMMDLIYARIVLLKQLGVKIR